MLRGFMQEGSCAYRRDHMAGLRIAYRDSIAARLGQMPKAGPAVETTQLSSSGSEIPKTLTPGPGDHFVFVFACMPAHSGSMSNGK